jgi:hypothetical protein
MVNKVGRPTNDPKPNKLTVKVSDETMFILDDYCRRTNKSRADGIRDGINALKNK